MNLQRIKLNGKEFVLLPASCYQAKKKQIDKFMTEISKSKMQSDEYESFDIDDYFDNPIAIQRIKRRLTQRQLAHILGCTQAYISQLERSDKVSDNIVNKVAKALKKYPAKW